MADDVEGDVDNERGSSPVEFVLVATLLTALTLAVLQLGLALYVRNVVHDAAVEGAHVAALADTTIADGVDRTRAIIGRAVGDAYVGDVSAVQVTSAGAESIRITVVTTLPVAGLFGVARAWEVTGSAPVETLE